VWPAGCSWSGAMTGPPSPHSHQHNRVTVKALLVKLDTEAFPPCFFPSGSHRPGQRGCKQTRSRERLKAGVRKLSLDWATAPLGRKARHTNIMGRSQDRFDMQGFHEGTNTPFETFGSPHGQGSQYTPAEK
jgi:hypothetical protein